jgi:hypothetical protein
MKYCDRSVIFLSPTSSVLCATISTEKSIGKYLLILIRHFKVPNYIIFNIYLCIFINFNILSLLLFVTCFQNINMLLWNVTHVSTYLKNAT